MMDSYELRIPEESSTLKEGSSKKPKERVLLPCPSCPKWYNSHNGLRTHVDHVHKGIRYKCSLCEKSYARRSTLRQHQAIDHLPRGQFPYRCPVCDEGFEHWNYLTQHKKIHIDPKDLPCRRCHEKFPSEECLKQHVKESHSKSKQEKRWQYETGYCYRNKYGTLSFTKGIRTRHVELSGRRRKFSK